MSDLRARQRSSTRELIIEATQQLVIEVHGWAMSMEQVAERAGVSRRTLYRYFPTKDELLEAASHGWADARGDADSAVIPSLRELERYLASQWVDLAENLPAVLAQAQSPSGRELRRRWVPRARNLARRQLRSELGDDAADAAGFDDLADLLIVLLSSTTFLELSDRLGHDPKEAARLAAWAAEALVEHASREGMPQP